MNDGKRRPLDFIVVWAFRRCISSASPSKTRLFPPKAATKLQVLSGGEHETEVFSGILPSHWAHVILPVDLQSEAKQKQSKAVLCAPLV
jgi:hypothetical protein